MRAFESIAFFLFLAGVLLTGVFGTWTVMAPMWLGAPLIWASAVLVVATAGGGIRGRLATVPAGAMLVFAGWIGYRALTHGVRSLALEDVYFGGTGAVAYYLMAVRFDRPWQRFSVVSVWGALIMLNLGLGLYQWAGHASANPLWFIGQRRPVQDAVFGGLFPNSNHLCGFMELAAFPLLALACFSQVHSFVRMVCWIVFAAAVTCVVMSTSRGGLAFGVGVVALAGMLFVLRAGRSTGRRTNSRAGMAVLTGLLLLGAGGGVVALRVLEAKFGEGRVFANLNGRGGMWERAIEQWQLSPITGTGARSYEYYERYFRDLKTNWVFWSDTEIDAVFAHNDWLQVLADYGMIGLVLVVVMLLAHAWNALGFLLGETGHERMHRGLFPDYRGSLVVGTLAGLCAFAVHCAGDFQMHVGVNVVTAAMLLGILANPGEPDERQSGVAGGRGQRKAGGVALLGTAAVALVLLVSAPHRAVGDYHFRRSVNVFTRADGLGGYLQAAAGFAKAVEANPKDPNIYFYWGMADLKAADEMPVISRQYVEKAIEHFEQGIRLYPPHPYMAMWLGRSCDALQRYDEAGRWFETALRWGNGSREVHHKYGDHLVFTKRPAEALPHFVAAMHRYPRESLDRLELQAKINYCMAEAKRGSAPVPVPDPAETP